MEVQYPLFRHLLLDLFLLILGFLPLDPNVLWLCALTWEEVCWSDLQIALAMCSSDISLSHVRVLMGKVKNMLPRDIVTVLAWFCPSVWRHLLEELFQQDYFYSLAYLLCYLMVYLTNHCYCVCLWWWLRYFWVFLENTLKITPNSHHRITIQSRLTIPWPSH